MELSQTFIQMKNRRTVDPILLNIKLHAQSLLRGNAADLRQASDYLEQICLSELLPSLDKLSVKSIMLELKHLNEQINDF
jgi:hypothetical protein